MKAGAGNMEMQPTAFAKRAVAKEITPEASTNVMTTSSNGQPSPLNDSKADHVCAEKASREVLSQRWAMLVILSIDICVNYLPYYTFVPIMKQGMQHYGVDEAALNTLCILYAIVYVPGAFMTGPFVGVAGCKWAFVLGTALTVAGCLLRCGPEFNEGLLASIGALASTSTGTPLVYDAHGVELAGRPGRSDFTWLLVGQFLCAAGQPFLCNPTSEMGAEWFPPPERPAAAMILNLMHFIGSSISFIMPPFFVGEDLQDNPDALTSQVAHVLRFQLALALGAFMVTLVMYKAVPRSTVVGAHRPPSHFLDEIRRLLLSHDFWIVNMQFAIFVGVCHAFDAVEGSLLEHYGYNASLTSWTAVSCGITSILATVFEARFITSPTSYRMALVASNLLLAASQLLGLLCLHFQWHRGVFVLAVGIMGMATPGWGCSCELGSEVCFPAREATVTSFLEAFSNLCGVFGIIVIQWLLDAGLGASVLLVTAIVSVAAAGSLHFLSNRLRRMEAEEMEAEEESFRPHGPSHIVAQTSGSKMKTGMSAMGLLATLVLSFQLMARPVLTRRSQSEIQLAKISILEPPSATLRPLTLPSSTEVASSTGAVPGAVTIVIQCSSATRKMERCRRHLQLAGISFETIKCHSGSAKDVEQAVKDGLILPSAVTAKNHGNTRRGHTRDSILGAAITHLRIMKLVAEGNASFVNVIHENEVVNNNFRMQRSVLLSQLPHNLDYVNFNAWHPAGLRVKLRKKLGARVFKMQAGLSPRLNRWLGNYVVSRAGARKILSIGSEYDSCGAWEVFDEFLLSKLYGESPDMGGFLGFSVQTNTLSVRCGDHTTERHRTLCKT